MRSSDARHMATIPALDRVRQEDREYEASLRYIAKTPPAPQRALVDYGIRRGDEQNSVYDQEKQFTEVLCYFYLCL